MNLSISQKLTVRTAALLAAAVVTLFGADSARAEITGPLDGNFVTALAPAADGGVWLAGTNYLDRKDLIGRRGPNGEVAVTKLPDAVPSQPGLLRGFAGIAVGADGNLWLTEPGTNSIGRWSPISGEFKDFSLATAGAMPDGITAGPDGDLWFTEKGGAKVGRIDTAGNVTEFPLAAASEPTGIAAGPDGNLWVTERAGNQIARLSTGGAVSEFPLPRTASQPAAIVSGPDGGLWFSENGAPRIGRIQTDGMIAEYSVPGTDGTNLISNGPAGDLWYTQEHSVGSIAVDGRTGGLSHAGPDLRTPIRALTKDLGGDLIFSTGVVETEGGGGSALLAAQAGGAVGVWQIPELSVHLGDRPHAISPTVVKIPFSCEGGAAATACAGKVKLMRGKRLLGSHAYSLDRGSGRSVAVRLSPSAVRLLGSRRSLRLQVEVGNAYGSGAVRSATIKALHHRN